MAVRSTTAAEALASVGHQTISRASTVDQVAGIIREMILTGVFVPGTPLGEQALATALNVSRNTVREAVRGLVAEGLVRHVMNQGASVASLDISDVQDLYKTRHVLEVEGLRAFNIETKAGLAGMDASIRQLKAAAKKQDWVAMVEADAAFHLQLVSLIGSTRLLNFARTIQAELRLGLLLVTRDDVYARTWIEDHEVIVKALKRGQVDEAIDELASHLNAAEQKLSAAVADFGSA